MHQQVLYACTHTSGPGAAVFPRPCLGNRAQPAPKTFRGSVGFAITGPAGRAHDGEAHCKEPQQAAPHWRGAGAPPEPRTSGSVVSEKPAQSARMTEGTSRRPRYWCLFTMTVGSSRMRPLPHASSPCSV